MKKSPAEMSKKELEEVVKYYQAQYDLKKTTKNLSDDITGIFMKLVVYKLHLEQRS